MNIWKSILLVSILFPLCQTAAEPTATIPPTPQFRMEETIVSYRGTGTMDYLGFPAIVPSGEHEIMLSYKRGTDHGWDPGAQLEIIRFDVESGRAIQDPIQIDIPDRIMEMGESYTEYSLAVFKYSRRRCSTHFEAIQRRASFSDR